jgi:hypothetical protein
MWKSRRRLVLECSVVVAALGSLLGCDRAKRETLDRVDDHDPSTWTSQGDCETLLEESTPDSTPRIGTWNVRYFPDSQEGPQTDEEKATNVQWLACAMASLNVDVLAVQEFKTTDASLEKQDELIQRLNELTAGDWQIQLAPCEPKEVQHPGFMYDATRVTGSNFREIPALNPGPTCNNEASPGFAGYFSIHGGPDFHLIAVHFQAGSTATTMEKRDYSIGTMQSVMDEANGVVPDTDIFFTGDFNTAGCTDCDPVVSSLDEVSELAGTVSTMPTPSWLVGASEDCSRHVDDDPPLLDHFVLSQSTEEVPTDAVAHVGGICEETHCDRLSNWLEDARDTLSDHCPVTLDLSANDQD